jgi:aspartate 1-decarboxylase
MDWDGVCLACKGHPSCFSGRIFLFYLRSKIAFYLGGIEVLRNVFKSKIHRAVVTEACLNYVGSITIDEELLEAADILVNEKVQVVNINNGERFETYAIPGPRGSGVICLNGAAARLAQVGDKVIIMTYVMVSDEEVKAWQPTVIVVDEKNKISRTMSEEVHGTE